MAVDAVLGAVAKAVVTRVMTDWLRSRSAAGDRGKNLSQLAVLNFPDRYIRRDLFRQIAAVTDHIERRIAPIWANEFLYLDSGERRACVGAVVRTFQTADLSDQALFATDLDPAMLATSIAPSGSWYHDLGLSEGGEVFYKRLLFECCDCLLRVIQQLPQYEGRADAEVFARLTTLGDQLRQVMLRMPRSLGLYAGADEDGYFLKNYLSFVSNEWDDIELFGIDSPNTAYRTTLSVAYLSLKASVRTYPSQQSESIGGRRGTAPHAENHDTLSPTRSRVEEVLGASRLTLVRGEAGSGKTTLLRWLAINAARGDFASSLVNWNDLVPVLITLRHLGDGRLPAPDEFIRSTAPAVAAQEPRGWAQRNLSAGRMLLLVDGVDEVLTAQRRGVASWLRQFARMYDVRIVVTSRPAAVPEDWLVDVGFSSLMLEPMSGEDVRIFVRQWHEAVWHASRGQPGREVDRHILDRSESALVAHLEARPHLRNLATAPLLCAMLCALNMSRRNYLPRDRMDLYRSALEMLDRRDAEREIPSAQGVALSFRQKEFLLQGLAWRLAERTRSELPVEKALAWTQGRLSRLAPPAPEAAVADILSFLILRSGVVREPVPGRIDFIHRSFLDYLAAKEAAQEDHVDLLVAKAHQDQWREVIVMTAGHASSKLQEELLNGILDRAAAEPRRARSLRLLAVSCLETVSSLSERLRGRLSDCIDMVLPPRTIAEARSLAAAGEVVLLHLPRTLESFPSTSAAATVRAVIHVGGAGAMDLLERYGRDTRPAVVAQLIAGWEYFDIEEYAKRVLVRSPLIHGRLEVSSPQHLRATVHLENLTDLTARIDAEHIDELRDLHNLSTVTLSHRGGSTSPARLPTLKNLREVSTLVVESPISPDVTLDIAEMQGLQNLHADFVASPDTLTFLAKLVGLKSLKLRPIDRVLDFSEIPRLVRLRELALWNFNPTARLDLDRLPATVADLTLVESYRSDIVEAAARLGNLRHLRIFQADGIEDITPLTSLGLSELWLRDCNRLADPSPIGKMRNLETLVLVDCPGQDLGFLSHLPRLTSLFLRMDVALDVRSFESRGRALHVYAGEGQIVSGDDREARSRNIYVHQYRNLALKWDRRRGWAPHILPGS